MFHLNIHLKKEKRWTNLPEKIQKSSKNKNVNVALSLAIESTRPAIRNTREDINPGVL